MARYRWTDAYGFSPILPHPGALLRSPITDPPRRPPSTVNIYVDVDQPAPRGRARTADVAPRRDANAGAAGERGAAGQPPAPGEIVRLESVPTAAGRVETVPTAGGVNPEEQQFDQASAIRVTGRDQEGKMWHMQIWGPHAQPGESAMIGDAALRDLGQTRDGAADVQGLAALQRQLNRHYAKA